MYYLPRKVKIKRPFSYLFLRCNIIDALHQQSSTPSHCYGLVLHVLLNPLPKAVQLNGNRKLLISAFMPRSGFTQSRVPEPIAANEPSFRPAFGRQ